MNTVIKVVLFLLIIFVAGLLGYRVYRFLNNRIRSSETGWQLLAYSALLFVASAVLFIGLFFALAYIYLFFATEQS